MDEQALRDGCVAAYVGGWHYSKQIAAVGNTWEAVGYYHSATPERRHWYANQIAKILMTWEVLSRGPLPFEGVPLLAPNQTVATTSPATADRTRATTSQPQTSTIFDVSADPQ